MPGCPLGCSSCPIHPTAESGNAPKLGGSSGAAGVDKGVPKGPDLFLDH
jgi:hypothetical protein